DDDWTNVRMALVSGRPISFQMDLYQPLYVPRPTVEPELFASLRPPTYSGAMNNTVQPGGQAGAVGQPNQATPPFGGYPGTKAERAGQAREDMFVHQLNEVTAPP